MKPNLLETKFLEMLNCPLSQGGLKLDIEAQELVCNKSKLAYPIRDGIPIMLPSEARPIE